MEKTNTQNSKSQDPENKKRTAEKYKVIHQNVRSSHITSGGGSQAGKYSDLVVGKKGIAALLKYEFLTSTFSSCPGAIGIFLRRIFYRFLFKKIGRGVVFGRNITIRHPNKITIGDNVVIDENCMLDAKGIDNKGIEIKNGAYIGRNTILSCKDGDIILEENVNIGFNCEVQSSSYVLIGKNTLIAAYVYIIAGDHLHDITGQPVSLIHGTSKGIVIGENCWLGAKATVLDGVEIGHDAVIGTSAVVNNNIAPFSVAVGIPAKVIKNRLLEQKEKTPE
jgi:acetyltransferase-like isoleucine patch superfamily enzyme